MHKVADTVAGAVGVPFVHIAVMAWRGVRRRSSWGCTEITLLVVQDVCAVPLADSTRSHAEAVAHALVP
ncbi:hypothetical protein [Saccharothrix espanaensis]|uniref:hypothetical protein n=1 Tax=Saccharothrix espanaensis TaxID=103731 RepID=UPI0002FB1235|nr:hypothetical protein [Saccharothrix espanaensis]